MGRSEGGQAVHQEVGAQLELARGRFGGASRPREPVMGASSGLPNMRLKLAGARVGRIALPRRPAFLSAVPPPCAPGRCARSLSAIR